jgi:hypothetical protein
LITTRLRLAAVAAATFSVLAIGASPALADDTVTQSVAAGSRTASVANLNLGGVSASHADQESAGTMVLTADDSTGSNAGWNVTVQTTNFVWSPGSGGASSGADIPAGNFSITSAAAPVSTDGQAVDATGGPKVPASSPVGTLDSPRKTVQAEAAFGNGTYTQDLGVNLTVPADSAAGTYTGTLTTTISAAP